MHPSHRDHEDMQRRGVQTFQAREGGGGVLKSNRKRPASISFFGERNGKVTGAEDFVFLQTYKVRPQEVRNSWKYLQVRRDPKTFL